MQQGPAASLAFKLGVCLQQLLAPGLGCISAASLFLQPFGPILGSDDSGLGEKSGFSPSPESSEEGGSLTW